MMRMKNKKNLIQKNAEGSLIGPFCFYHIYYIKNMHILKILSHITKDVSFYVRINETSCME